MRKQAFAVCKNKSQRENPQPTQVWFVAIRTSIPVYGRKRFSGVPTPGPSTPKGRTSYNFPSHRLYGHVMFNDEAMREEYKSLLFYPN